MELTPEEIQLWFHLEEVAMHFNQLIMQYRLQLMGGAGAIGVISSYLIGSKVEDLIQRHWLRFIISLGLLIIIIAAAALDVFYYNQLLQGAVDALLEFESTRPDLNMSTLIEKKVSNRGIVTIYGVYLTIIIPLAVFTWWSWREHSNETNKSNGG